MIVDLNQTEEGYWAKFSFNAWQESLAQNLVTSTLANKNKWPHDSGRMRMLDMGRGAGHTFFAHVAATRDFPLRTKVYTTNRSNLAQYADLIINTERCYEIVDVIPNTGFAGYNGNSVELIVIDMATRPVGTLKESLRSLFVSTPPDTIILLLQPALGV